MTTTSLYNHILQNTADCETRFSSVSTQLLAGKHLIYLTILVVHLHNFLCIRRHVLVGSTCNETSNVNHKATVSSNKRTGRIVFIRIAPLFSPSAVHMQIVPDGMVVEWITGKFQTLWANLNSKETRVSITWLLGFTFTTKLYIENESLPSLREKLSSSR